MEAIIARPAAGATLATPASPAQGRKATRGPAASRSAAKPESTVSDWRSLVRPVLDEAHDILLSATHPTAAPMPLGLPTELATHSVVALRELLTNEDDSAQWQHCIDTLHALQWPRHSMQAAVALLGSGDDESCDAADVYRLVSRRLDGVCTALELVHDLPAMSRELQQASVEPFREKLRPPIRREPAASADDSQRVFSELAQHASTLRDFLLDARHDVERTGDKCKAANNFLMAEYLCTFMGSVCDQMVNFDIAGGPAEWAINRSIQTEGGAP